MIQQSNVSRANSNPAPGFVKVPDYDLKLRPDSSLHQVIFGEAVVAASDRAIVVHEQNLRPVIYFPQTDVEMTAFQKEEKSSYCPFKGTATYWTISANGCDCASAAWSYDDPFNEVAALQGHIAFYMDKMDCHWRDGAELPLIGPGRCDNGGCNELRAA